MNVIVVEDAHDISYLIGLLLTDDGHSVTVYSKDFEPLLTPEPWEGVDVAVVDLMLGEETSGADILGYLYKNHPTIRRVVFSAVADILSEGSVIADAVLHKPASYKEILAAVRG